ncbi:hypothetical protein [Streptomyces sp. NPDC090036]|uniref:hypothetical protein n=1 Tax=Streptomyces sp. NPDC090036 TaxID=3365926 RepID=UPI00380D69FE
MEFPERSPREVEVRAIQKRHLFRAQAGVIEGPEHRIVPGGGCVLAGGGDPGLEEVEELRDLLWGRWRQLGRGVITDMPGRVELIDRADQADAEPGLDLDGLAHLKEPVETLEDLHVLAAGGGRPPGKSQVSDDTVEGLDPGFWTPETLGS